MFAKLFQMQAKRTFSQTARFAQKEGLYSNIPFKVHNRKIPYAVVHTAFFSLAFIIPVIALVVQWNRHGDFAKLRQA